MLLMSRIFQQAATWAVLKQWERPREGKTHASVSQHIVCGWNTAMLSQARIDEDFKVTQHRQEPETGWGIWADLQSITTKALTYIVNQSFSQNLFNAVV